MRANLIFDSNYIAIRNVFGLCPKGSMLIGRFLDTEDDQAIFIKRMIDDVSSVISMFPKGFIHKVIWCVDSHSWRKDLFQDINYKGEREKDDVINWEVFHDLMDELAKVLNQCGVYVSKIPKAEADDLIYLWSKKLLEMGESSIIVSSDKDISQILHAREDGNIVCMISPLNGERKFVFDKNMKKVQREDVKENYEDEIFNPRQESPVDVLLKVASKNTLTEVDPEWVLLSKVLLGDKSDNIPAIIQWKKGKEGMIKTYSLTERMLSRAGITEMSFPTVDELNEDFDLLRSICAELIKVVPEEVATVDGIIERFQRNEKLIRLHESNIPNHIKIDLDSENHKRHDISYHTIYSLRPEWKKEPKESKTFQSDVFNLLG